MRFTDDFPATDIGQMNRSAAGWHWGAFGFLTNHLTEHAAAQRARIAFIRFWGNQLAVAVKFPVNEAKVCWQAGTSTRMVSGNEQNEEAEEKSNKFQSRAKIIMIADRAQVGIKSHWPDLVCWSAVGAIWDRGVRCSTTLPRFNRSSSSKLLGRPITASDATKGMILKIEKKYIFF